MKFAYINTLVLSLLYVDLIQKNKPHIYKVDQKGNVALWDSLGFATTGSGGELAFLEMTKWYFGDDVPLPLAMPRIYFAKKSSERAEGVGRTTDFAFLGYSPNTGGTMECNVYEISSDVELIKKLDKAFEDVRTSEAEILGHLATDINDVYKTKAKKRADEKKQSEKN